MRIYAIVVYSSSQKPYSAALEGNAFRMDPHEKFIRDNINHVMLFPRKDSGIHMLINQHEVYQAYLNKDKIIVFATDGELNEHEQIVLIDKILKARNSIGLMALIKHPDEAVKSKADKINEELHETKEQLITIVDKLRVRGENLADLMVQVEALEKDARFFKQKSTELKNKYRTCSSLFTLYYKLKGMIWRDEPYEYEYRVTQRLG